MWQVARFLGVYMACMGDLAGISRRVCICVYMACIGYWYSISGRVV